MDISVIIVSYNVSSFLDQALTTVKDAARNTKYEIFVVDNASSDDSVSIVKSKHPSVKLIENKVNLGFGRANNQALKLASGKYILILNPDTVLSHDTLRIMIDFLDSHPETGAAGCKVINPDGSLQLACRRGFPTPGGAFFKMVGLSNLFPKSKTFGAYNLTYLDPDSLTEVDAISGSFMMLRKQTLTEVGFFDEDFFMYGEDLDLCYRIKQAGWKIYYVPWTEIIHFKGESTKTVPSLKSVRVFYDAMQIFVDKHHSKESKLHFPRWLLITAIYAVMGCVYGINLLKNTREPIRDLVLLNISLVLGIFMRFNISLDNAPEYSNVQWVSIFVVYSMLYMTTFYFLGIYHRYRNSSERALLGVFIGFLFNIFIVNFIKEYNFSRLASFYSWGFNTIFISGWRFVFEELYSGKAVIRVKRAIIVGSISDAVTLRNVFKNSKYSSYDLIGCIETTPGAIRGREVDGLHILGLINELSDIMHEYSIDVAIMAGSSLPYSKILSIGRKIGTLKRPEFKFVPEIPDHDATKELHEQITLIDILPGKVI
ncbi:MAG: glycosyltransferase [Candidatus Latescibacteria bacterium]|nr:glycosyltransferase [Candidatus Latescibacterota bacterium]